MSLAKPTLLTKRPKNPMLCVAAIRKDISKVNLFRRMSNTFIRKSSDKSLSKENNKTVTSQLLHLRQRSQEVKSKRSDIEIRQAAKRNNEISLKKWKTNINTNFGIKASEK